MARMIDMPMPRSLFVTSLDRLATKYYKRPAGPDEAEAQRDAARAIIKVAEGLLVAPKLTFKVEGENVVLAILINAFGADAVERLLRTKAIEFLQWTEQVLYLPEPNPGINPLGSMTFSNVEHVNPEVSCEKGLQWLKKKPDRQQSRTLIRLAVKNTRTNSKPLAADVVKTTINHYEEGHLQSIGLGPDIPMFKLSENKLKELAGISESMFDAAVMLDHRLDLFEDTKTWDVLNLLGTCARSKERVLYTTNNILEIERCPAIDRLLLERVIGLDEIVDLRRHKAVEEYRSWLWSQPDPTNAEEVTRAYTAAVLRGERLWETKWFKVVRILAMGALGSAAGGVVAGPAGLLAGPAVATSTELAVSLFDGLLLDSLLEGKNPRHFTSEVISKKLIAAKMASRSMPPKNRH